MDAFSIAVGTVGVLDVCLRLVKYIRDFEDAVAGIDQELRDLCRSLDAVAIVVGSIREAFGAKLAPSRTATDVDPIDQLWKNAGTILGDCQTKLRKLEQLVVAIKGGENPKGPSKFDSFKKQLRKQSKDDEYGRLRRDLDQFLQTLQTLLQIIELSYDLRSQATSDQLSDDIRTLNTKIESLHPHLEISEGLRDAVDSAKAMVRLASSNKHFDIPQTVSSIFTGREAQIEELGSAFLAPVPDGKSQMQRRFVISGLGGSGKTQWCCKFAQDYRKHFWGVYWISASSLKRASQTFARLAKEYGAREPNEAAAKDWLSNLEVPWLLIIDDAAADDSQFHLESLFPKGQRGHILITTRDETHRIHGTVGSKSFMFGNLDREPATQLLLKAADKPAPWDSPTLEMASMITNLLGYLPLALVYAGKAIVEGLCTMQDYAKYYKTSFERIGQAQSDADQQPDQDYMNVYSGFEIVYLALGRKQDRAAKDALELLNMFAFLSNGEIRESMLEHAATNPAREQAQQEKERLKAKINSSWAQTTKDLGIRVLEFLLKDHTNPVLPQVLCNNKRMQFDLSRLRKALRELSKRSLIIRNADNKSYSLHPVIHVWVRERPEMVLDEPNATEKGVDTMGEVPGIKRAKPEMRIGRQALWCEAAATVLTQAILLPPLGDQEADEDLRRELLPHIEYVRKRQDEIRIQISHNQGLGKWLPAVQPMLTPREALRFAKYSRVYSQSANYKESENLLLVVRDFVSSKRGADHPITIRVQLGLAGAYLGQGRGPDAANLLEEVLKICTRSFGDDAQLTLQVMDLLGENHWQQGRVLTAKTLHETAIDRMTRTLGAEHEDTLRAITHLGRVHDRFLRYHEAKRLHSTAWEGMRKADVLGPNHHDTLTAQDSLAMAYLCIGGNANLELAYQLETDILNKRKQKLGKEHQWTLHSVLNLSRINFARGFSDEAERGLRAGLMVAHRNLGAEHFGTLFGESRLGLMLICQKCYAEAEGLLLKTIETYKIMPGGREGRHPDRLSAMFHLAHCYRLQQKFQPAINICHEIISIMEQIEGRLHPYMRLFEQTRDALSDPNDRGRSLTDEWIFR